MIHLFGRLMAAITYIRTSIRPISLIDNGNNVMVRYSAITHNFLLLMSNFMMTRFHHDSS